MLYGSVISLLMHRFLCFFFFFDRVVHVAARCLWSSFLVVFFFSSDFYDLFLWFSFFFFLAVSSLPTVSSLYFGFPRFSLYCTKRSFSGVFFFCAALAFPLFLFFLNPGDIRCRCCSALSDIFGLLLVVYFFLGEFVFFYMLRRNRSFLLFSFSCCCFSFLAVCNWTVSFSVLSPPLFFFFLEPERWHLQTLCNHLYCVFLRVPSILSLFFSWPQDVLVCGGFFVVVGGVVFLPYSYQKPLESNRLLPYSYYFKKKKNAVLNRLFSLSLALFFFEVSIINKSASRCCSSAHYAWMVSYAVRWCRSFFFVCVVWCGVYLCL